MDHFRTMQVWLWQFSHSSWGQTRSYRWNALRFDSFQLKSNQFVQLNLKMISLMNNVFVSRHCRSKPEKRGILRFISCVDTFYWGKAFYCPINLNLKHFKMVPWPWNGPAGLRAAVTGSVSIITKPEWLKLFMVKKSCLILFYWTLLECITYVSSFFLRQFKFLLSIFQGLWVLVQFIFSLFELFLQADQLVVQLYEGEWVFSTI